jgi:hypothetical protein
MATGRGVEGPLYCQLTLAGHVFRRNDGRKPRRPAIVNIRRTADESCAGHANPMFNCALSRYN